MVSVEGLQRLGAQHRAWTEAMPVIQWHVEVFGGQQGVDEPPGVQNFSSWLGPDAAGVLQQFAQGDAQRLVPPGPVDIARTASTA